EMPAAVQVRGDRKGTGGGRCLEIMEQILDRFIQHLELERHFSPFTVRNYRRDLEGFLDFLRAEGIASLEEVERPTLRRYLAHLSEQSYVKSSIARKLSALRSFYRFLGREGLVSADPAALISAPKQERRLPSFLTLEEVKGLLGGPDLSTPQGMRDRAILELLYASGLRVSEIVRLEVENVDLPTREIRVWGKRSKERMVLMGEPAATALEVYLRKGRPELLGRSKSRELFINRYGGRLAERRVQHLVEDYAREAGIEKRVHPHLLRHTFATHLLDGGADLRVVQELLGHTSLASTQVYTHVSQSQARKVYLAAHPRAQKKKEAAATAEEET
ncbi:MAG: tyrosine recombinase XerC, partial [Dehalococcoidia bacterium]